MKKKTQTSKNAAKPEYYSSAFMLCEWALISCSVVTGAFLVGARDSWYHSQRIVWNEPHDTLAILVYSVQIKTLQQCLYALRPGVDLAFRTRLMKPCLHLLSPKCENSTMEKMYF